MTDSFTVNSTEHIEKWRTWLDRLSAWHQQYSDSETLLRARVKGYELLSWSLFLDDKSEEARAALAQGLELDAEAPELTGVKLLSLILAGKEQEAKLITDQPTWQARKAEYQRRVGLLVMKNPAMDEATLKMTSER